MDGSRDYRTTSERERQMSYTIAPVWNLNYDTSELIYETETDSQTQRADLWLPGGRVGGGMHWGFGISRCKLLYRGWINDKFLLCSTGNYIQYPVINHNGEEYEKECICITESLSCIAEMNITLLIIYMLIKHIF